MRTNTQEMTQGLVLEGNGSMLLQEMDARDDIRSKKGEEVGGCGGKSDPQGVALRQNPVDATRFSSCCRPRLVHTKLYLTPYFLSRSWKEFLRNFYF